MATRLVEMGRKLNGKTVDLSEPNDATVAPDQALNDAKAQALGNGGDQATQAYEASLPDDGGAAEVVKQPTDVERFSAAMLTWNGGSNFTDNPEVRVQRRLRGEWTNYADQSGEVPVTLKLPARDDIPAYEQGDQNWHWTAVFEAFVSRFNLVGPDGDAERATPAGVYRFVVDGHRREGGQVAPYHLVSQRVRREAVERAARARTCAARATGACRSASGRATRHSGSEIGPIDYPDSYDPTSYADELTFINHNPANNRSFLRDPQASATRRASSGTAWPARSGRGPTPATP